MFDKLLAFIADSPNSEIQQYAVSGHVINVFVVHAEAYSETCQTSKMELFATIVNGFQPLNISAKSSFLDD